DIALIQEPFLQPGNTLTSASHMWRVVYPTKHHDWNERGHRTRAVTFINTKLSTDIWEQLPLDSPDSVAIRLHTPIGHIVIINIY
ncbi:hypothetical protein BDY19DRAFT_868602, partial [Irpex rosettiformis]